MKNKNKNGFIAMSLIFSFFIVFVAIMIAILVNFSHTRVVVNSINDEVIKFLENGEVEDEPIVPPVNDDFVFEELYTLENNVSVYELEIPENGNYKIELWGAGDSDAGYVAGTANLVKDTKLLFYVGGTGAANGYNGGASGKYYGNGASDLRLKSAQEFNENISLNSRIMVAAGGGGGNIDPVGAPYGVSTISGDLGAAGGLVGYQGSYGYNSSYAVYVCYPGLPGTQFAGGTGGTNGSGGTGGTGGFGTGGAGGIGKVILSGYEVWYGYGGSGGYYGSGGSSGNLSGMWSPLGTAGASSFISGHAGCVAIASEDLTNNPRTTRLDSNNVLCSSSTSTGYKSAGYNVDETCSEHYSEIVFNDTLMIDGKGIKWEVIDGVLHNTEQVVMPNPLGGNYTLGVGHTGNGYARITYVR